jgi:mono/diheme cytochrome c family protein
MSKRLILSAMAVFAATISLQSLDVAASVRKSAQARPHPALSAPARRGLAFAQQRCSGCHGVVENSSSPNPESPPFEDIANRPNVTQATLRQFLRDSHNYPAAMSFEVDPARISDLAAYIVTLKKPGYRPLVN